MITGFACSRFQLEVARYFTGTESKAVSSDNQQFPSCSTPFRHKDREAHILHSSQLLRGRFYHSRIKNEHSTRGARDAFIFLLAPQHCNRESERRRIRPYVFFKLRKLSSQLSCLERTSMRLIRKSQWNVEIMRHFSRSCAQWAATSPLFCRRQNKLIASPAPPQKADW